MVKRVITWIDLQGRYRVTSPAYDDPVYAGKSEDDMIALVWVECLKGYGLPANHPFSLVEDSVQRVKVLDCGGEYFRYVATPDKDGRREAIGGAWEMDTDGTPKVDMSKARGVQMDYIRRVRDVELERESGSRFQQPPEIEALFTPGRKAKLRGLRDIPQTFDLSSAATPKDLMNLWPAELPARVS